MTISPLDTLAPESVADKLDALRELCRAVYANCDKHTTAARKRENKAIAQCLAVVLGRKPAPQEIEHVADFG